MAAPDPLSTSAARFSQRLFVSLLPLLIIASTSIGTAQAPVSGSTDTPESLTTELAAADSDYQVAQGTSRGAFEDRLVTVAERRYRHLRGLVERDPASVLRVKTPKARRDLLPARARNLVEEELATEGELEVLTEDYVQTHQMKYFLRERTGRRYSVHFARLAPALRSGTQVRMHGVRVGTALALASGAASSVEVLAAALPNTVGNQRTVVILVNFANDPANQPYSTTSAQNVVFNQTSALYQEGSFGQTWLTGDVFGWFTIASTNAGCDSWTVASQADAAAVAAGVNLSAYTRKVYAFPSNGCGWWGLGTVGGNPSRAWINGTLAVQVVGHEMGHNLGLYHAHSMDCGATTLSPTCTSSEYGDTADIMGWSTGHFGAFNKERLGWLNHNAQPPITTVSATGTYNIGVYEPAGPGSKALKIQKSIDASGRRTWYYLEYRQATNAPRGVLLRLGTDSNASSSYMLDGTPDNSSFGDAALPVGQSFVDAEAGITMTPLTTSSTGASIRVVMGAEVCAPAAPLVAMNPSQSTWVTPGTPVVYTVLVTNRDAGGCLESSFSVTDAVPEGWTHIVTDAVLTLAAGASDSTTLTVTSPLAMADGFYPVSGSATAASTGRPAGTQFGSASATHVIVAGGTTGTPETMSVTSTLGLAPVRRGIRVSLQASVNTGTTPIHRARVVFTITKPNGKVVTRTPGTNRLGATNARWVQRRADPLGTYLVRTTAMKLGVTATAPDMTFEVR